MNLNKDNTATSQAAPVKRSRKEIVKTLIIIFLLIMLILTFFSNTIMNRSLAEVSVTRLSRESLKRSSPVELMVEANKTYSVTSDEAREIKRVAVKRGQEVKEGQVLFYLKEVTESEAVKSIRDEIDSLELAYEKSLLKKAPDYYDLNAAVQSARDELNAAIYTRDNPPSEPSRPSVPDNSALIAELRQKKALLTSDKENLEAGLYDQLSPDKSALIAEKYESYTKAEQELSSETEKLKNLGEDSSSELLSMNRKLETLNTELTRLKEDKADARSIEDKETEIRYLQEDIAEIKNRSTLISEQKKTVEEKITAAATAKAELGSVVRELKTSVDQELSETELKLSSLEESTGGYIPDSPSSFPETSDTDYDAVVRAKQYAYDAAVHSLEQKIADDKLINSSEDLELASSRKKIDEKKKKLDEMLEKQTETEIKSEIDGVVEEIKVSAGQAFEAHEDLMTLNISGDGFTSEYSAESDKVKRISKGQTFKPYESRDDVLFTVSDIKKDKNDGKKTKLIFSVTGSDAVSGLSVKVDIGDEPVQMDNVIPKTAVKEDSKGKFVYAVRSKSSPLGNRYIVSRVDVTVKASDDTKVSVSGEFGDSADYIITASSKPFNPGDQVRLSEE